jgi:hypothetical protein
MNSLALRIALAIVIIPFGVYAAQGPGAGQHAPKPPLAVERSETLIPFPGLDEMYTPGFGAPIPDKPPTDTSKLGAVASFPPANGFGIGGGDMPEAEPNNGFDVANVAHDMPFDCMGTISYATDYDYLKVTLTAGQPIQINVFRSIGYFSSPLDPMIWVVAENMSTVVAYNDDISFPWNLNSEVRFSAPYTGNYYLIVRSATLTGGPTYNYIISAWTSLNPVFDFANLESEPNDSSTYATPLTTPGISIGSMSVAGDVDWTVFAADAGTTLVIDVHSQLFYFPMDPVVELYDGYGHRLFANDDMDGRDSRFNILIPATGNYYLKIADYSGGGGMGYTYIASVSAQFGTGAPTITALKYNATNGKLKKVVGTGFDPSTMFVEVDTGIIPSLPSAANPTTVRKVKPQFLLPSGAMVTMSNPDGRRSNPMLHTGS